MSRNSARNIVDIWQPNLTDRDGVTQASMINHITGERYLNSTILDGIPRSWLFFIKKHEECHYCLQTRDEDLCDAYAFYAFARKGYKLSDAVLALTRMLHEGNPMHEARVARMWDRVYRYDWIVNGNEYM